MIELFVIAAIIIAVGFAMICIGMARDAWTWDEALFRERLELIRGLDRPNDGTRELCELATLASQNVSTEQAA